MTDNRYPQDLTRRCPRLGGPVSFSYCGGCGRNGGYCWKVLNCWWEYFDVADYLRRRLSADEFAALCQARPRPKVTSLIEIIERARAEK